MGNRAVAMRNRDGSGFQKQSNVHAFPDRNVNPASGVGLPASWNDRKKRAREVRSNDNEAGPGRFHERSYVGLEDIIPKVPGVLAKVPDQARLTIVGDG